MTLSRVYCHFSVSARFAFQPSHAAVTAHTMDKGWNLISIFHLFCMICSQLYAMLLAMPPATDTTVPVKLQHGNICHAPHGNEKAEVRPSQMEIDTTGRVIDARCREYNMAKTQRRPVIARPRAIHCLYCAVPPPRPGLSATPPPSSSPPSPLLPPSLPPSTAAYRRCALAMLLRATPAPYLAVPIAER